jgi:hypothetical protein
MSRGLTAGGENDGLAKEEGRRGKGEGEGFPSSARGACEQGEQGVWFPASWRGTSRADASNLFEPAFSEQSP